jgi:hypothetical protein
MPMRAMGRLLGVGAVVATAILAGGCMGGDGAPVPTLTRDDVTGLPPGDATGTTFSGYYLIASSRLDGCHCRVGQCGLFYPQVGGLREFAQVDGALTEVGYPPSGTGGVNADGTFWMGFADESSEMTQYVLDEGQIQLAAGVPVSASYTVTVTFVGTLYTMDGDTPVDCDLRGKSTLRYQGPLDAG